MARPDIRYVITPSNPGAHLFEVTLSVGSPDPQGQVFSLPTWIPGSYMIREFSKNIVQIRAFRGGREIALTKRDKSTWQAAAGEGAVELRYTVYAWDLSVRTAHLDQTHGFFNGTSVFLRVHGREADGHGVRIDAPRGAVIGEWRVATTLPRAGAAPWSFGEFEASSYDELIDHPVEMGTFEVVNFEAAGVPHAVALTGKYRCDTARLAADLQAICEHQIHFFGMPAPMDSYLFMVMVVGNGYGGLEHRSSTALVCKRDDLPQPGVEGITDGYRQFLGLCSHEYFHTWNVKRIKPRVFVPYELDREAYTTMLWAFEGITSYYDDLMLVRAGLLDLDGWLELVGRTITRVRRGSGRTKQSLSDSSFDAWTKFYRQDENASNAIVSYYAKGSLAALALDLEMRRISDGAVCLDHLMHVLWYRFGHGNGVPEDGVEAVASELVGQDLSGFFDRAIRGTQDLPLEELLATIGLKLNLRASTGDKDRGGKDAKPKHVLADPGDLGVRVAAHKLGSKLAAVLDGGAAQAAGLSAGDVVIAMDDLQVKGDLTRRARALPAGTRVVLHAFRRDELMRFDVSLGQVPRTTAWLSIDEDADDEVLARRAGWLEGVSRAQG